MPVCFENAEKRDEIYSELVKNGINPRKYFYPLTINLDYFKKKGINLVKKYGIEEANDIANRVLCFPLFPDLEIEVVGEISSITRKVIKNEPRS